MKMPTYLPTLSKSAALLTALAMAGAVALSMARPPVPHPPEAPLSALPAPADGAWRLEKEGAVVELSVLRPGAPGPHPPQLSGGDYAEVRFRLTDAVSGLPMRGLSPAAWMDLGRTLSAKPQEQQECKERVALYLQRLVGVRPLVDLNSYYLLVLNQDPSVSVIDPLMGMTGKTNLYATLLLERPGADWVKGRDGKRLFISMPRAGKVAVVDTEAFRVQASVEAGTEPTRVALQPDGRYLWVGNNASAAADSGVTVVDTDSLEPVAHLRTGRGHHEIAFSSDDRYAFVSNRDEGTVSVIDIARLEKVKELRTGPLPISLAFSPLSQVLYVADGKDGTIVAVGGPRLEEVARLKARPGLGPMRFSQDGRWGFVVNPTEHAVHIIDAAHNRLAHTVAVSGKPYQVSFTRAFAYVRLLDSERVEMVNLATLGTEAKPAVNGFAAGAATPERVADLSLASSMAQAATEAALFVVNPAESTTYFYMEGMNAPMGSFGNYGHSARAVTVVDRSLEEVEPGVYATRVRIPAAGKYDIAFLLDSPRVLHCFSVEAKQSPTPPQALGALEIDYADSPSRLKVGQQRLRFRLKDAVSQGPAAGLKDVSVLTYQPPGRLRAEVTAREVEPGLYEAEPVLTAPGAYYLYVSSPSSGVRYGGLSYRTLWVEQAPPENPHCASHKPATAPTAPTAPTADVRLVEAMLVNQDGVPVNFKSEVLGDQLVVMNFVFTTCTTVCPVLSSILTRVQQDLGERQGGEVRLFSLSVDPTRDTPERLKAYAARHRAKAGWSWLTGSPEEMKRVLEGLGAYTPDFTRHAPMVLVGDPRTGVWTRFNGFPNPEQLLAKVDELAAARREVAPLAVEKH